MSVKGFLFVVITGSRGFMNSQYLKICNTLKQIKARRRLFQAKQTFSWSYAVDDTQMPARIRNVLETVSKMCLPSADRFGRSKVGKSKHKNVERTAQKTQL